MGLRLTETLFIVGVAVALSIVLFLSTPAWVQRAERLRAQDKAESKCPCKGAQRPAPKPETKE